MSRPKKTIEARFWAKVKKTESCWLWTGAKLAKGYGSFGVGPDPKHPPASRRWKLAQAHRFSWELHNGLVPDGQHVLHRCDTPACVNPAHLFLGTNADNVRDRQVKKRHARGERNATAKLTEDDVCEIRRRALEDGDGPRKLGRDFGVKHPTIIKILRHEYWSHVK